jgi:hypothetical protein
MCDRHILFLLLAVEIHAMHKHKLTRFKSLSNGGFGFNGAVSPDAVFYFMVHKSKSVVSDRFHFLKFHCSCDIKKIFVKLLL